MRKKPLSVTLDEFELDLLRALALHQDRSLSYVVGHAIEVYAYHGSKEYGEWGDSVLSRDELNKIEEKHGLDKSE
jgi:hypothetical protein